MFWCRVGSTLHLLLVLLDSPERLLPDIAELLDKLGKEPTWRKVTEHINLNSEDVLEAIQSGALGKIIEVNDPEGEDRIEIIIES